MGWGENWLHAAIVASLEVIFDEGGVFPKTSRCAWLPSTWCTFNAKRNGLQQGVGWGENRLLHTMLSLDEIVPFSDFLVAMRGVGWPE